MRLEEVEGVGKWLPASPLASDRLWQRDVAAITDMDIQMFYARASVLGQREHAVTLIEQAQAAVIVYAFKGGKPAPSAALVLHEPPPDPFMVDELVDGLIKLPEPRRQACLFALEMAGTPQQAADLMWSDARQLSQLSPLCLEVLASASRTRHLRLPYVFWEWATSTIATPLLELQWSIEQAFDCSWPELTRRYRMMIQLNRSAEAASFLELANKPL